MLVDHRGKPLSSRQPRLQAAIAKIKTWFKKSSVIIGSLVALTALLINLDSLIGLYERFSQGPTYGLKIQVSNNGETPIEVISLLDYHIAITQFHSGRLMAGEAPTGRIRIRLASGADDQSPYLIQPGKSSTYTAEFRQRPYKDDLNTGGSTIIFVLHLKKSDKLYYSYIEQPFHAEVMKSTTLRFEIK